MGAALPMQAQPLPTAALSHYTALAREAELLKALREACAEIEQWATHAFRMGDMTQAQFERMWLSEDRPSYQRWETLKYVAGLPFTNLMPEPVECDE